MTTTLKLKNSNKVCLIDIKHLIRLNRFVWRIHKNGCVYSTTPTNKYISLPNIIFMTKNIMYDHIDRNALNNLEVNLRPVSHSQNMANTSKRNGYSSKYKGVSFYKASNKWRSSIFVGGKKIHIGHFDTEEKAAIAYDRLADRYFGEFAWLNFQEIAI